MRITYRYSRALGRCANLGSGFCMPRGSRRLLQNDEEGSHLCFPGRTWHVPPPELLERGLVRRGQFQPHVYERMMRAVGWGCSWSVDETVRGCGEAEAMTHPPRPSAGLSESPIESLASLDRSQGPSPRP